MHLLTTSSASLDDLVEPVDLGQTPADIVALSFTDSDLAGIAAAWKAEAERLPSMRLAALRDLRHPMSVDLWIDSVAAHAKVILVRILGGYDWWRYGCDQLAAMARAKGIKLALLPGECRDEDLRLIECSTLPRDELDALLGYFREGGPENMSGAGRRLAALAGHETQPRRSGRGAEGRVLRSGQRRASRAIRAGCAADMYQPALPVMSRSSSTAPCCSPPTSRRSTRCARRCAQRACAPCRSSSPA